MNSKTGQLLLVDDELVLLEILRAMLEDLAVTIDTAANGAMALEMMEVTRYDAIISDISMPIMTGLQLLAEMRAREIDIPLIVLTSYSDKSNILQAFRLGAIDFLEKPFDPNTLRKLTRSALDLGISIRNCKAVMSQIYSDAHLTVEAKHSLKDVKVEARMVRIVKKKGWVS